MKKYTLTIDYSSKLKWNQTTQNLLSESELFDVVKEDFPAFSQEDGVKEIGRRRGYISFFKINGILIGLDTWDGPHPTALMYDFFNTHEYYKKTKLILKIQYKPSSRGKHPMMDRFIEKTCIPVTNWTMFYSRTFPLEAFQWKNCDHKYLGYMSGKRRGRWRKQFEEKPQILLPKDNQNKQGTIEEYIDILKQCKWGLCLRGKCVGNMDVKNRREVEFSSLGLPLVLNYKPEYPFPFEADKDYVYIEKAEDLIPKMESIDPAPFHEASKRVYREYFCKEGSARLLIKLLEDFNLLS